jgi:hypothetical protein
LLGRNFQPLTPPYSLDPFDVHDPTSLVQHCRHGGGRGLEVFPGNLRKDHLVQCQIGNFPAEASVLGLQFFRRFT